MRLVRPNPVGLPVREGGVILLLIEPFRCILFLVMEHRPRQRPIIRLPFIIGKGREPRLYIIVITCSRATEYSPHIKILFA